jgi:hypothetical protein
MVGVLGLRAGGVDSALHAVSDEREVAGLVDLFGLEIVTESGGQF